MMKNKMMRLASVLLVAVLLSTCAISGTFAKYVNTSSGNDTARVAKWGFKNEATISFENLFASSYQNVKNGDDEMAIIAPGTSGFTSFAFKLETAISAPEVAYSFTVGTGNSTNATASNSNITWRLTNSETAPTDWKAEDTWDNLLLAIKKLSGDESGSKEYAAGAKPDMIDKTYYIHWNWKFDGDDNLDNELGNMVADQVVTLEVSINATQKD